MFPLTGRNLGGHLQSEDAGGCHARWGRPRRRTRDRVGVSSHACITSRGTMSDQRLLREKARTRAVGSWRPAAFPIFVCGSTWSQRPPRGLRGCRLLQKQSDWGRVQRERAQWLFLVTCRAPDGSEGGQPSGPRFRRAHTCPPSPPLPGRLPGARGRPPRSPQGRADASPADQAGKAAGPPRARPSQRASRAIFYSCQTTMIFSHCALEWI